MPEELKVIKVRFMADHWGHKDIPSKGIIVLPACSKGNSHIICSDGFIGSVVSRFPGATRSKNVLGYDVLIIPAKVNGAHIKNSFKKEGYQVEILK